MGLPGSGKSEVANIFREQGIPVFRSGDVVREEVVNRGLELTIENSEKVARQLREEFGDDAPARLTMEKVLKTRDRLVCIEGPRDMRELACIAGLSRMVMLVVRSDDDIRFERLTSRGRGLKDPGNRVQGARDPRNGEEFRWRDRKETERGLGEVMSTRKYARYELENNGTLEELRKGALGILGEIKSTAR